MVDEKIRSLFKEAIENYILDNDLDREDLESNNFEEIIPEVMGELGYIEEKDLSEYLIDYVKTSCNELTFWQIADSFDDYITAEIGGMMSYSYNENSRTWDIYDKEQVELQADEEINKLIEQRIINFDE